MILKRGSDPRSQSTRDVEDFDLVSMFQASLQFGIVKFHPEFLRGPDSADDLHRAAEQNRLLRKFTVETFFEEFPGSQHFPE